MVDGLDKLICCDNKRMIKVCELGANYTYPAWYNELYQCKECKKIALYKYTMTRTGKKDKEEVETY
jgi:hypothetical protein